jgi:hypothetical protein
MAGVWLDRRGWQEGDVPNVCMKCGRPAPERVKKVFSYVPPWVYLLILVNLLVLLIVALALRQKRTAWVPLCAEHKGIWRRQLFLTWGSLAATLVVVVLGSVLVAERWDGPDASEPIVGLVVVGLLVWLVCALIAQAKSIRATEFSKRQIRIVGVCREFIDAYDDEREEQGLSDHDRVRLDEVVRQRWNERQPDHKAAEAKEHIREDVPGDDPPRRSDQYRPE